MIVKQLWSCSLALRVEIVTTGENEKCSSAIEKTWADELEMHLIIPRRTSLKKYKEICLNIY